MRKENSIVRQTNRPTEKRKRYNSKLLSNYVFFAYSDFLTMPYFFIISTKNEENDYLCVCLDILGEPREISQRS